MANPVPVDACIIDMAEFATDVVLPRKKLDALLGDFERLTDALEHIVDRAQRAGIRRAAMEEIAACAGGALADLRSATWTPPEDP